MGRRLKMAKATPARTPRVTDHAVLRWLERYLDMDIDAVRASILTPERREAIECGATRIHCPVERVSLVINEQGAVVTVSPIHSERRQ